MKRLMLACAMSAAMAVVAQETENAAEDATNSAAPTEEGAAAQAPKAAAKVGFTPLPLCRLVESTVDVRLPGGEWAPAEEGRFYPLGCSYRTKGDARLVLAFSAESTVTISGDAEFATRVPTNSATRTIALVRGTLSLKLPDNMPEGAFFVAAPGFTVKNPAGESRYVYVDMGDGDKVTVRCITGSLGLEGRHFDIPVMRSADEVVIRSGHDYLTTFLYGTSGDYAVVLDQGLRAKEEVGDDGQMKRVVERATTEWRLSPATKVMISRTLSTIGTRMSVHTMAFDAAGERKSECAFCEGRAEVNTGELVPKESVDSEELAKRAAEATETTAPAEPEDKKAEGESSDESATSTNE